LDQHLFGNADRVRDFLALRAGARGLYNIIDINVERGRDLL
jgi:hypothetical protein